MELITGRISLDDADDQTLIGRSSDGDVRAFEVLMRRYGPLMQAYARRVLGAGDDVEDAIQETFITAWRELPKLEASVAFRRWLITITTRKSIDQLRRRREHSPLDESNDEASDIDSPHVVSEARSRQQALSAALSLLPADQRRTWMLREIAHYSYDHIAADLQLPPSTIRGLLSRARKNLMAEMEDWR